MGSRMMVVLALIAAPLLHGCAAKRAVEPADPREEAQRERARPEDIPLLTDVSLPGCRYHVLGDMIAADLQQLRGEAFQKQADAVLHVRQRTLANRRPTSQVDAVRPAARTVYTGIAVKLASRECLYSAPAEGTTGG